MRHKIEQIFLEVELGTLTPNTPVRNNLPIAPNILNNVLQTPNSSQLYGALNPSLYTIETSTPTSAARLPDGLTEAQRNLLGEIYRAALMNE